jgi:hypothetical protein
MAAAVVYVLCFFTSLACTILLLRGYMRSKTRLLLWTGLCFAGMAINNAVLFMDRVILPPQVDLFWLRILPILIGVLFLLYGLIWEAE